MYEANCLYRFIRRLKVVSKSAHKKLTMSRNVERLKRLGLLRSSLRTEHNYIYSRGLT